MLLRRILALLALCLLAPWLERNACALDGVTVSYATTQDWSLGLKGAVTIGQHLVPDPYRLAADLPLCRHGQQPVERRAPGRSGRRGGRRPGRLDTALAPSASATVGFTASPAVAAGPTAMAFTGTWYDNCSGTPTPTPVTPDYRITDLANTSRPYQDRPTSFFFGDAMTQATSLQGGYFAQNRAGDTGLSACGLTVTWGEHMTVLPEHGIIAALFGAGVSDSTDGVGSRPTDDWFWIQAVQEHYRAHPAPLPSTAALTPMLHCC
ncbi:MAG: hypothetical protein B193_1245 [Solidesulfovibrio magneticus str. Maddingley MBC34]|uniref:Uncharacterized protein n=1 Tax=Solidesulfovibrio magneticus str. Maddingley MBC34 TaxID=1206767 RepID=K6HC20_9BACT|nr:MAG: hypothetical protein B193_1245 [Solidesulfovibrio magneticus str. Maddingley MBC34]